MKQIKRGEMMEKLASNIIKPLVLSICFLVVSCATITVNVYFPAEEVRDAYSSLEEEFLEQDAEDNSTTDQAPDKQTVSPTPKPQSKNVYPDKPALSETKVVVIKREISLDFSNYAWAQGNISQQIAQKIRAMPKVINAYKSRAKRQGVIDQMLSQKKVVEGSQGLLVQKTSLTPSETQAFNAENSDRKTIIQGMARAIVEINNLDPTPENINKVLPEAARQFASVRRSGG
ncbi:MAG: lipoprotein [Thermodesulfobacteriota bacterium]|nr:MAG: lipoprotein [Thermodesulfobacteriota bacterium]